MPATPRFLINTLLSKFNKRNDTQNEGGGGSDVGSPVATIGLVIAALTLLIATIPLFRCQRFYHWVSSLSILSFVKFCNPTQRSLGIITPPNPPPTIVTTNEDLNPIPVAEIPVSSQVLIYNDYTNTHPISNNFNTSPYCHNVTTREGGRISHVEERLGPSRPELAVTRQFP
ncbi:hypothetical protein HOY82DRAFT_638474 [Tuber indicum]|nr:hypothetical protein HOY82DRAFT_638474 [Tuber indicum]